MSGNVENLKLERSTAVKIYNKASREIQEILISSFGKECFSGKIIDRIKTYEDAWNEADQETRRDCEIFPTDTMDVVAYKKLKLIARVINQGWIPDWDNSKQYKWFPYFDLSSGFGFSDSGYRYTCTRTAVGSRLCFQSEENATYVGKQFTDIYKDFLT
ncbi:MAG: hypothetical protein ACOYM0_01175 [Bacteroidales bacterium]